MKSKFNQILHYVVAIFKRLRDLDYSLSGEIKLQRYTCAEGHYLFVRCRINNMNFSDLESLSHELPRFKIDGDGLYLILHYESIMSKDGRKEFSDY